MDAHTEVRLCGRHDELGFAIVDDGVGCDVESARRSGTGFASLHERVASLGGHSRSARHLAAARSSEDAFR